MCQRSQVDFMLESIPMDARVLVIAGGQGVWREDLKRRGGLVGAARMASWTIATELSDDEAKDWAAYSRSAPKMRRIGPARRALSM